MRSAWLYGFFDSPNHPRPDVELAELSSIQEAGPVGGMVELRLPDREDPPGKRARPGDLFLFFVRGEQGTRIRGRALVGGNARTGAVKPWMTSLYGPENLRRHWLPFSLLELHQPREPALLGLRDEDLPDPAGQAYIKRLRSTEHLNKDLLGWWQRHSTTLPSQTRSTQRG